MRQGEITSHWRTLLNRMTSGLPLQNPYFHNVTHYSSLQFICLACNATFHFTFVRWRYRGYYLMINFYFTYLFSGHSKYCRPLLHVPTAKLTSAAFHLYFPSLSHVDVPVVIEYATLISGKYEVKWNKKVKKCDSTLVSYRGALGHHTWQGYPKQAKYWFFFLYLQLI